MILDQDKSNCEQLIRFEGKLNGNQAKILIDSGASRNYLDAQFAQDSHIIVDSQAATHPSIELADSTTSHCSGQAQDIVVELQTYQAKKQAFDVLKLSKYDAILGKPWLWDANPTIDWRKNQVKIRQHLLQGTQLANPSEEVNTLTPAVAILALLAQ